jgi:hypothetical protein
MTSTAINPEVVGLDDQPQVFEESPMTETEEKELVIVKTAITTAYADKLERDLAIGAGLLKIFRDKLYRGKDGGRTWETWLADESAELTAGRGAIGRDSASYLRGFYQFRCEMLQPLGPGLTNTPLPTSPKQVRPLLGQLDAHPKAALDMWKAACSQAGKNKVPTFDQVNRAAIAYKAIAENEARRLSAAQQAARQRKASPTPATSVPRAGSSAPSRNDIMEMANHNAHENCEAKPFSSQDFSPEPPSNAIPAWELEAHDDSVDAGAECKRITHAMNDAFRALATLRGILYSQTNKYGSDYLDFLRQVDAGVYSLNNIDDQIEMMANDFACITALLNADVGEGELAQSTLDVEAIPTR